MDAGTGLAEKAAVATMRDAETLLNQADALHLRTDAAIQPDSLLNNLTANLQGHIQVKRGCDFSINCLESTKKEGMPCI